MDKQLKVVDKRNYGIDLLRILAMFFVVVLHSYGKGGILDNTIANSIQYKFSWFIEICAFCAVNIFALISGYVSYGKEEKRTNFSNYFTLWLQVVFYGLLVNVVFNIINPDLVSRRDYLNVLLPVTNKLYWYFSAYTGLFILMPFLNKAIRNCSDMTLKKTFIAIFLLFSVIATYSDVFVFKAGYSVIWIMLLYIMGAIIKKCKIGDKVKVYQALLGILALYVITYLYKMYGYKLSNRYFTINGNMLISYISPTILGSAILYVIAFSKIKFCNIFKKIIKFAAPSAFTIYLLNNHALIWRYVMNNLFIEIVNSSVLKIFAYTMTFSVIFVIASILIDKIRIYLFKVCKVKDLTNKLERVLNKIITKCAKII